MCDYSLAGIPNRLAVEGEELVVYRFPASLGLASPCPRLERLWSSKATPAVCVPPGARLRLRDIPEDFQRGFHVGKSEEVTFVQLSATAYQYRDAVRFKNGREVLLQALRCGQRVDVLCLSGSDSGQEAEHQRLEEEYCRVFAGADIPTDLELDAGSRRAPALRREDASDQERFLRVTMSSSCRPIHWL
jgi:hypothetical protein